jgi:tRNA pseudouridine55 synthase
MLGVVNLDKPVGPTSHDMVGLLRRLTGTRRIGHAGTLDPLASGVLPILIGAATRCSAELTGGAKRYRARIRLGWRSATDDAEGPLARGSAPPAIGAVSEALRAFTGSFDQRPPTFSARKLGGQTAHRAARAGVPVELPPRRVSVERIELTAWEAGPDHLDVEIDLRCGPGTYVRSIARDLGEVLGCGGYLAGLRRTEAAGLRVEDASSPEALEALAAEGRLGQAVLPLAPLLRLPVINVTADDASRFAHGSAIVAPRAAEGRHTVQHDGRVIGIGRVDGGRCNPEKVLVEAGA